MKLSLMFFFVPIVIVVIALFYSAATFSPVFSRGDFRAQYTAAHIVHTGSIKNLYDMDAQLYAQRTFLPTLSMKQMLPFYSPVLVAIILSPLGKFNFPTAYLIFGFSQLFFLLTTVFVIKQITSNTFEKPLIKKSGLSPWHILLLVTGCCTVWMSTLHGQLAAVWMLVLAGGWLLYQKKKYLTAGLILSLLFLKLHLVIAPLLLFAVTKKWRVVAGMALGIVILTGYSIATLGWQGVIHYFDFLIQISGMERSHGVSTTRQTSLLGIVATVLLGNQALLVPTLPSHTLPIWIALVIIFCSWTLLRWYSLPHKNGNVFKLMYAHMIAVMLFTSIHTHTYDMSMLFISCILYFDYILSKKGASQKLTKDTITVRYYLLAALLGITLATFGMNVFSPFSLVVYCIIFYFIETEYGKILKQK